MNFSTVCTVLSLRKQRFDDHGESSTAIQAQVVGAGCWQRQTSRWTSISLAPACRAQPRFPVLEIQGSPNPYWLSIIPHFAA